jgi:cytochrome c-type protein NapB
MSGAGFAAALPSVVLVAAVVALSGCEPETGRYALPGTAPLETGASTAAVRAERRLFDGAPPVVPHTRFSSPCIECHNVRGVRVQGVGFAPPSPHERTDGIGANSRCVQCHIASSDEPLFVANDFVGLRQDLRRGRRLHDYAPPVIPHQVFMRENCAACHAGASARAEIRTNHPERTNCRQCHLERTTVAAFAR